MTTVLPTVDQTVVDNAKLVHVSMMIIGLLLYFTHVERRLGKALTEEGVALALLSEFVIPVNGKV